ncbi:MAG TPA: hypothetical protein VFV75_11485 [Candidatus Polarisedimenticolaceae bacterium]|nr:hypothetical protein [Candidatus Polarisedimenticolaceae bacterium]
MSRILRRRWLLSILMAAAAAPATFAAANDACVSANINAPFWLPDGALHAPGKLTLCSVREFSPVANLHRLDVDGMTVGVFLSRKRVAEGTGINPEIVFSKDAVGNLKLLGYSLPEREGTLAFRLPPARPLRGTSALARLP